MPQQRSSRSRARRAIAAHDQQPGQSEQRRFAPRIDLQHAAIGLFGLLHPSRRAKGFGEPQRRLVPVRQAALQLLHQAERARGVAGLLFGERQIEQCRRRGLAERDRRRASAVSASAGRWLASCTMPRATSASASSASGGTVASSSASAPAGSPACSRSSAASASCGARSSTAKMPATGASASNRTVCRSSVRIANPRCARTRRRSPCCARSGPGDRSAQSPLPGTDASHRPATAPRARRRTSRPVRAAACASAATRSVRRSRSAHRRPGSAASAVRPPPGSLIRSASCSSA